MNWPWSKKATPQPSEDAKRAKSRADHDLERARAQRIQAHDISLDLIATRRQNHFGEALERAIRKDAQ